MTAGDPTVVATPTDLPPRRFALIRHRERYRTRASMAFLGIARHMCVEHAAELGLPEPPDPAGILPASPATA